MRLVCFGSRCPKNKAGYGEKSLNQFKFKTNMGLHHAAAAGHVKGPSSSDQLLHLDWRRNRAHNLTLSDTPTAGQPCCISPGRYRVISVCWMIWLDLFKMTAGREGERERERERESERARERATRV